MLDDLDRIDWSQLSHAYGAAIDVPELIHRLTDGSSEVRETALAELFSTIWHQGTVYDATSYAVPFLIELVTDTTLPDRSHVLYLLHAIAEGWLNCQRYAAEKERKKFVSAETTERHARERLHYQSAHSAVASGVAALLKLLSDEEAEVRVWAAFLLSLLIDQAGEVTEALLDAIDREADNSCRSALQFALVALTANADKPHITDTVIRRLTSIFEGSSSEVDSLSAGIALLQLRQNFVLPRVLELARPRLVTESGLFESFAWPGATGLYSLINKSLKFTPPEQLKWIVEGLNHTDREIRSLAMGLGVQLCEEFRWGPSKLVPHYAQLVEHGDANERRIAMQWMRSMGTEGITVLTEFQNHRLADVRANSATQLKHVASNRKERVLWLAEERPFLLPSVTTLLKTIESHKGSRKWDDERKVRDAVIQLGFHGQRARSAIDLISSLTERENPWIRVHAVRALWRITQNPAIVLPRVEANLDPLPAVFLALDCLQQMGHAGQSLESKLRTILETERRFFREGWTDTCALDEAFCDACRQAIQAINAPEQ